MALLTRRAFAVFAACACVPAVGAAQTPAPSARYVCPPCGCSYDGKVFDKPGICPDPGCAMTLVPAPADTPPAPAPQGASL